MEKLLFFDGKINLYLDFSRFLVTMTETCSFVSNVRNTSPVETFPKYFKPFPPL